MKWYTCSPGKIYNGNDSLAVYFDPASGDTHLLGESGIYVLELLLAQPLSTDNLMHTIAEASPELSNVEREQMLDDVLQNLQSFDLIEAR